MTEAHAIRLVVDELTKARAKFPAFNSYHEGWAVIQEEVDELWGEVKGQQRQGELRDEAVQVAAMGLRFLIDCCKVPR